MSSVLDAEYRVYAEAISDLASYDEDYGTKQNDVGFSRFDAAIGHVLAETPFEQWSIPQLIQAHHILGRYKNTQLPGLGYIWSEMPDVSNLVPVRDAGTKSPGYAEVDIRGDQFLLRWGGADPYFNNRVEDARTLPGARYNKDAKAWSVPITLTSIDAVANLLAKYAATELPFNESETFRAGIESQVEAVTEKLRASEAKSASREELSLHRVTNPDIVRPFQLAGIKWCVDNKQTILSDDMGLGKSAQSLISVAETDAFPCLIICPASLKLNWKREIEMWVGNGVAGHEPNVYVASGTKPKGIPMMGGPLDFFIINYDIMNAWKDVLSSYPWKSVICDEVHMAKSEKSLRTKAIKEVLKTTNPEYRFMLTGTPILNRPIEIWPVLGMIGGQKQFGGWFSFAKKFCNLEHNGYGYSATGATNLEELNVQLRSSGLMIRRRKEDVLTELPDKQWVKIPTPLGPASLAKAYENATRDLEKFLSEMAGEKVDIQAEVLQRIATLRQLAWRGKEKAAREWIDNFLETDKKLIVFGWHRDAVMAIANHYNAPVIMGGMKKEDVEENKRRFQEDDDCRIIVCNIAAGGVGHTLTAASDVLFLEYPWNYALMDQALSRCLLEGTPVLTPDGWRPVEDISVGDQVIGRYGQPRKVLDTWSKGATKVMVEVDISGMGMITTTHDHPFLNSSGEWVYAGDLRPGDELMIADKATDEGGIDSLTFDEDCRRSPVYSNQFGATQRTVLRPAPASIVLDKEALFTLGYYVGDGFSGYTQRGRYPAFVSLSGNTTTKVEALDRATAWMESHGLHMHERVLEERNTVERRFASAEWCLWFRKQFGHLAANKRLPEWVYMLSCDQKRAMLEGMVASDGYRRNRGGVGYVEYVTASDVLAANVFALVAGAGYRPSIRKQTKGHHVIGWHDGEPIGKNGGSRRPGRVSSVTLRHPKRVNGKRETVYDLTIEGDESFVAGGVVVHNSHRLGQKDSVTGWMLVATVGEEGETIDHEMIEMIEHKEAIVKAAVDGDAQQAKATIKGKLQRFLQTADEWDDEEKE